MDELKVNLRTKLMRNLLAKRISKLIFKKTGHEIEVVIEEVGIEKIDGKVKLHVSMDAEMSNEEFMKIVKRIV